MKEGDVRCQVCNHWFDPTDEAGWQIETTANVAEGTRDPDYLCSAVCMFRYAQTEWLEELDRKLRVLDQAAFPPSPPSDEGEA